MSQSQCEATRNGALFCTNPTQFITLVCPVCRQRFDYVLCADHAMTLRCARDNVLLAERTDTTNNNFRMDGKA